MMRAPHNTLLNATGIFTGEKLGIIQLGKSPTWASCISLEPVSRSLFENRRLDFCRAQSCAIARCGTGSKSKSLRFSNINIQL